MQVRNPIGISNPSNRFVSKLDVQTQEELNKKLSRSTLLSYGSVFATSGLIALKTATPIGRTIGALHMVFGMYFTKMALKTKDLNNSHM